MPKTALLVVDVQNDFTTGTLAVPDAGAVVKEVNELAKQSQFDVIIATKDWHPKNHTSFASSHGKQPFKGIEIVSEAGEKLDQPGWPDHCVQDTWGAEFSDGLSTDGFDEVVHKGDNANKEFYSAFRDVFRESETGLNALLKKHSVEKVCVVGLALDFCVLNTALDAASYGYDTTVLLDATRAISAQGHSDAVSKLKNAGVAVV